MRSQDVQVNEAEGKVKLSKIFYWYARDFGATTTDVLQWIQPNLAEEPAAALGRLLRRDEVKNEGDTDALTVEYADYDGSINAK